eukprot:XP_001692434.1 predicted protein [Chlamydomonas reinhardtii]
MRVCVNAVLLLDEESTGTVGIALLRGDILTVLAHGFARVAGRLDGDSAGGSSSGAVGGGSYRGGGSGPAAKAAELLHLQQQAMWVFFTVLTQVTAAGVKPYERGVGSELAAALDRSGVLEHAAAALLRLAARLHGLAAALSAAAPAAATAAAAARGAAAPNRQRQPRAAGTAAAAGGWEALCASTDRYPSLIEPVQSGIAAGRCDADADAAAAAAAAAAEETRRLLCGPAVQLFLLACVASAGADSIAARAPPPANAAAEPQPQRRLQYPAWLPEALRLQWPDEPSSTLVRAMSVAARALQATVMGRGGVLPFAQPPHGHRPGQSPRPLLPHPCPFPSAAVHVYDIAARTCHAVFAGGHKMAAAAGAISAGLAAGASTAAAAAAADAAAGGAGSHGIRRISLSPDCVLKLLRLLLRLLPELRPRQAAVRLPGLWQLVVAALPLLVEMPVNANRQVDAFGLITEASLLIRLRLDAAGEVPPPPVFPPPPPQRQPPLVMSDTAPAAEEPEAAGVACCGYSLRCALDAGLLPVLERLLRRAVGGLPPHMAAAATFAAFCSAGGGELGADAGAVAMAAALGAVGASGAHKVSEALLLATHAACSVLLESGVFPAALAHGAVAELVPLLTTIGCVLRCLWNAAGRRLVQPAFMSSDMDLRAAGGIAARLPVSGASAGGCWKLIVASLLNQVMVTRGIVAAQQQPSEQQREQQPPASEGIAGSGSSSAAVNADASEASCCDDTPAAAMNSWLLPDRIDPAWLAAAGGAPPAGTAARGQQDVMHNLLTLLCVPSLFAAPAEPCLASPVAALNAALEAAGAQEYFFKCVLQAWFAFHASVSNEVDGQVPVMTGRASRLSAPGGGGSGGGGGDAGSLTEQRLLAKLYLEEWSVLMEAAMGTYLRGFDEIFKHVKRAAACSGSAGSAAGSDGLGEGRGGRQGARGSGSDSGCGSTSGGNASASSIRASPRSSAASGSGPQDPPLDVGGPRRPLSDTEHAVVARRVLDLMEVQSFCLVWCRMGSGVWLCPPDALPFLFLPPWALAYLERWGPLHERPWLQGLLLPAPAGGVDKWSMPNYEAAAAVRAAVHPLMAEQVARGQDAFSQLVLRIQKRIFEENWEALRWTPAALRLACDALEEDAAAAAGAGAAAGDGASGSGTTAGASDSAAGGAQSTAVPTICGNPFCRSLDGPSALIAPGAGKTCSRCRRLTYCCGACQLEHWTQGRHRKACPELVKLNQMRQARGATPL